jgi:hypothetical protein
LLKNRPCCVHPQASPPSEQKEDRQNPPSPLLFWRRGPAKPKEDQEVRATHAAWVTLGDAKSSLRDAKSSLGDAKSSLGDAKSSLGDAKSSLRDAKSSLGDAESSLGDAESFAG